MREWQEEKTAPIDEAVLIWDGRTIAVGRKNKRDTWWIDESFGFNEDGEIYGVTHWMPLPSPPIT